MQTYTQTFAGAQTWQLNVPGKYFATLTCTNPVNVRFYKGGKKLDLGDIQGLLAGLEVVAGDVKDTENAFDRVEIDVTGADTVTVGIGNGQSRYNRINTNTTITNNKLPVSAAFANTAKTVTNATAQLVAANTSRQYLLIQNKDASANVFINFGAGAATTTNGVRIPPGGSYETPNVTTTQAIQAIGDTASNPNVVVVEG